MEIEILKQEKGEVELSIDNLTLAEILRVYLNRNEVDFAAWRREHPVKPLIFKIKDSNLKKAVSDAIGNIKKDLKELESMVKKR